MMQPTTQHSIHHAVEEAMETLERMRGAAPPVAAARLEGVMSALSHLRDENEYLHSRLMESLAASPYETQSAPKMGVPQPQGDTPSDDMNNGSTLEAVEDLFPLMPQADDAEDLYTTLQTYNLSAANNTLPDRALSSELDDLFASVHAILRPSFMTARQQAEALSMGRLGGLSPDQKAAAEMMESRAAHALALFDAAADIQALRAGSFDIRLSTFKADDLMRTAKAQMTARAEALDHPILLQMEAGLPLAYGDFACALVILTDILDNALRYTPFGGSTRMTGASIGTHLLFTVEDTGIGLTAEDLPYIGTPFWRAEYQPMVRTHLGTGLRLYLAREVLAHMGGELVFSGEPRMGSTFSFTLPIAENR